MGIDTHPMAQNVLLGRVPIQELDDPASPLCALPSENCRAAGYKSDLLNWGQAVLQMVNPDEPGMQFI